MHDNNETWWAVAKNAFAWICAVIGSMTASQVAIYLAIAFTASQLYWGWSRYLREKDDGQL